MRTNQKSPPPTTFEGGVAEHQTALEELTRAVSTCLLWENTFYEKGNDIAKRIEELCRKVRLQDVAMLAIHARENLKLRHVPLFLLRQLLKYQPNAIFPPYFVADTIKKVIQRPDEIAELLSIYWKTNDKKALPAQLKKGLAAAFTKFNEYQLAKWNKQDRDVKLRDALFLCHAKPVTMGQAYLWKSLVDGTLATPDTWEVALSAGADKKETWERLISENRIGAMAILMNLRNMIQAGVDRKWIAQAITKTPRSKALPFRYITAFKYAPGYAQEISDAMEASVAKLNKLVGNTLIVIDVSGSMDATISQKSQLTRMETAAALAVLFRYVTPQCSVWTFSQSLVEVPNYKGLPLVRGIVESQQHGGTYLAKALMALQRREPKINRIIVITDEQAHDGIIPCWAEHGYIVNVAPYKPGLDTHNGWTRISGWSERLVDWISYEETGKTLAEEEDESAS